MVSSSLKIGNYLIGVTVDKLLTSHRCIEKHKDDHYHMPNDVINVTGKTIGVFINILSIFTQ